MRLKITIEKWKSWDELTSDEQKHYKTQWFNKPCNSDIFDEIAQSNYEDDILNIEDNLDNILELNDKKDILIEFNYKKMFWQFNSQGWYFKGCHWTDFITMKDYNDWYDHPDYFENKQDYKKYVKYRNKAYIQRNKLMEYITETISNYIRYYPKDEEIEDYIRDNNIEFCVESEIAWNKNINNKEKIC